MSISLSLAVSMMTGTLERCRSCAADLGAGQPGQHQVEQHQVGAVAVERVERVGPGRRDGDLEALLAEHVRQGVGKDSSSSTTSTRVTGSSSCGVARAVRGVRRRRVGVGASPNVGGQPQGERRAGPSLAPHGDLAAVVGGDVLDDRQAEPGAAGGAGTGRVDAVEALEDALQVLVGDADALVGDARSRRVAAAGRTPHARPGCAAGL